jgi:hypothetical protein
LSSYLGHKLANTTKLEEQIVEIMICRNCTLVNALNIIFGLYKVDTDCIYDMMDFLEKHLPDLDSVSYHMNIYTGNQPDVDLKMDGKYENPKKE